MEVDCWLWPPLTVEEKLRKFFFVLFFQLFQDFRKVTRMLMHLFLHPAKQILAKLGSETYT